MSARASVRNVLKAQGNAAALEIAERVLNDRSLLGEVVRSAESPTKRLKNAAAKTLKIVSEREPAVLYARFDSAATSRISPRPSSSPPRTPSTISERSRRTSRAIARRSRSSCCERTTSSGAATAGAFSRGR